MQEVESTGQAERASASVSRTHMRHRSLLGCAEQIAQRREINMLHSCCYLHVVLSVQCTAACRRLQERKGKMDELL